MTNGERAQPQIYTGGNEVLFSFFETLLECADRGEIPHESIQTILRNWGASLVYRSGVQIDSLGLALDWLGDSLATLGLVRVFTPADVRDGAIRVLTMRCMVGRYVGVPRVRRELHHVCLISPLVEGVLASVGKPCRVVPSREGMLRGDECYLTITAGEVT